MIGKIRGYLIERLPGGLLFIRSSAVAKNAGFLYVIQLSQYLIPLIVIPYLVRTLGPAGFGKAGIASGLAGYFAILVDYGFSLSATRAVAVGRDDVRKVSGIFTNTIAAKFLLFLAGFAIILALVSLSPVLHGYRSLILIAYAGVLGNVIFPVWLWQGMENMRFLAISNLSTQLLVAAGIFLLVRSSGDVAGYLAITSLGTLLNGLMTMVKGYRFFGLRMVAPSGPGVLTALREGWSLFLSSASVSLYLVGNSFLLGLFASTTQVGYYSAAEKLVRAAQGIFGPITQAVFPKLSVLANESREAFFRLSRTLIILMTGIGLAASAVMFAAAPLIVRLILGGDFAQAVPLVRILSLIPLLTALSNALGAQLMLPLNRDRPYAAIIFAAGIVNIAVVILLAARLGAEAPALALVGAETFVTIAMLLYVQFAIRNRVATS